MSEKEQGRSRLSIPKNHPLCFKWALAAAKQGDRGGQTYTGDCYEQGWGVEPNVASAFEWYMKAAEQEDEYAQYYISAATTLLAPLPFVETTSCLPKVPLPSRF